MIFLLQREMPGSTAGISWWVASHYKFTSLEPFSEEIPIQDADDSSYRDSNQIRGLVCHDRSKRSSR